MKENLARIVYFEEEFPDITVSKNNSWPILWPCYACKVAIPIRGEDRLNPFEELVLQLSAQGLRSPKRIADFLYPVPEGGVHEYEDLILCVQSRLMARGFLDSRFEIKSEGKKKLDQLVTGEDKYETAIVYQDWDSGGLLPVVHFRVPEYPEIIENDPKRNIILFSVKIKDDDKKKYASIIRMKEKPLLDPTSQDVTQAFYKFRGRFSRYGFIRKSLLLKQSWVLPDSIGVPRVQSGREPVYLHCKIILNPNNNKFLVSDGFGLGYSDSFLAYLVKKENKLLTYIRDRANKDKAQDSAAPKKNTELVALVPYSLKRAQETIEKWKKPDSSGNDAIVAQNKEWEIKKAAESLYTALEFSLGSLLTKYPAEKWANLLFNGQPGDYNPTIKKSASDLGFSVTDNNSYILLNEPPGAFREIQNSDYKLQPLLILAILAASDVIIHPCNDLARGFPDFLDFVREFSNIRNPLKHGDASLEITTNDLEGLLDKTRKAIYLLFPEGLPQDQVELIKIPGDIESFRNQRGNADFEIAEQFGNELLASMEPNLLDTLYKLKMRKESDTDVVKNMCNALAIALHLLTWAHKHVKPEYSKWMAGFSSELTLENTANAVKAHAMDRAKKYGLLPNDGQLPPGLERVRVKRIRAVISGRNNTLGANCVALLAVGSDDTLSAVSKRTPDLVQFAVQLADMRRHGNMAKIGDANLGDLEKKLFDTVKRLLEVIYG